MGLHSGSYYILTTHFGAFPDAVALMLFCLKKMIHFAPFFYQREHLRPRELVVEIVNFKMTNPSISL